MKLTKTTLLIAATLVMASTSSFAANNKALKQFNFADKNKDGQVTAAEMATSYAKAHKKHPDAKWAMKAIKKHGDNAYTASGKGWVKRHDKNGDGIVTLNEVSA